MRKVNIREARQKLGELLDAAEHGESILINRHGKEVARIEPARRAEGEPLPDLTQFRESLKASVRGKPLSQMVTELREQARY